MQKFLNSPIMMFNLFAITLGLRDVFSEIYLSKSYSPALILLVFSAVTILLAYGFRATMFREWTPIRDFRKQPASHKFLFVQLGLSTFIAFIMTIYGIKLIGAALFSVIEHSLMPISTIFLGVMLLGEKFRTRHLLGIIVCIVGIILFLLETTQIDLGQRTSWFIGVCLSVICSYLTSLSSYYQKKLIQVGVDLSTIIKYRFVPCFIILLPYVALNGELPQLWAAENSNDIISLIFIGALTFALPMLFLCFGFVRSSLQRFATYILLIPIYTFILAAIIIPESQNISSPLVISGILTVFAGYVFVEFNWIKLKPLARESHDH